MIIMIWRKAQDSQNIEETLAEDIRSEQSVALSTKAMKLLYIAVVGLILAYISQPLFEDIPHAKLWKAAFEDDVNMVGAIQKYIVRLGTDIVRCFFIRSLGPTAPELALMRLWGERNFLCLHGGISRLFSVFVIMFCDCVSPLFASRSKQHEHCLASSKEHCLAGSFFTAGSFLSPSFARINPYTDPGAGCRGGWRISTDTRWMEQHSPSCKI